jgi:hypothetical protein
MLAFRLSDMELDDHVEAMLRHWMGDADTDEAQPIDLQDQQHDEQGNRPADGQELDTEPGPEWDVEEEEEEPEAEADGEGEQDEEHDPDQQSVRRSLAAMSSVWRRPVLNTNAPYGVMLNCPSTLFRFSIGLAADAGYTQVITRPHAQSHTHSHAVQNILVPWQSCDGLCPPCVSTQILTGFGSAGGPTAAAAVDLVELDLQVRHTPHFLEHHASTLCDANVFRRAHQRSLRPWIGSGPSQLAQTVT